MFAQNMLNKDIPHLNISDTGNVALDIMERYKISHLPIVENEKLIGVISESEIFDFQLENIEFKEEIILYKIFFVFADVSLFEVINAFKQYSTTIIPVIDRKNSKYLGLISPLSVVNFLTSLPLAENNLFTVYILMNKKDFTATQLSNIVESNVSKLFALLYSENKETQETEVLLKIKSKDIESVLQSFEHFGYHPVLLNVSTEKYDDFYKKRLDNFLKFINI